MINSNTLSLELSAQNEIIPSNTYQGTSPLTINDTLVEIFAHLSARQLATVQEVCRQWRYIGGLDSLWSAFLCPGTACDLMPAKRKYFIESNIDTWNVLKRTPLGESREWVYFSGDSKKVAIFDNDNFVITHIPTEQRISLPLMFIEDVSEPVFSEDNAYLAYLYKSSDEFHIAIWDTTTGQQVAKCKRLLKKNFPIFIEFKDMQNLVIYSPSANFIWNFTVNNLSYIDSMFPSVFFVGANFTWLNSDGVSLLLDRFSGKELVKLDISDRNPELYTLDIVFSRDKSKVAKIPSGKLCVWNFSTEQWDLISHEDESVWEAKFSCDNLRIGYVYTKRNASFFDPRPALKLHHLITGVQQDIDLASEIEKNELIDRINIEWAPDSSKIAITLTVRNQEEPSYGGKSSRETTLLHFAPTECDV